jgi:hypothetical protein
MRTGSVVATFERLLYLEGVEGHESVQAELPKDDRHMSAAGLQAYIAKHIKTTIPDEIGQGELRELGYGIKSIARSGRLQGTAAHKFVTASDLGAQVGRPDYIKYERYQFPNGYQLIKMLNTRTGSIEEDDHYKKQVLIIAPRD